MRKQTFPTVSAVMPIQCGRELGLPGFCQHADEFPLGQPAAGTHIFI